MCMFMSSKEIGPDLTVMLPTHTKNISRKESVFERFSVKRIRKKQKTTTIRQYINMDEKFSC